MLKLIIADDERVIRETISTLIDWKQYDIQLAGLCSNGQRRNHLVGNKAGIFPQEQGTAHMIAQLIVIFLKGNTVRGDAVPEVMSPSHGVLQIEPE